MGNTERTKNGLLQALSQELTASLVQFSSTKWTAAASNEEAINPSDAASSAIFRVAFTGLLQGELFLSVKVEDLPQLDLNGADAGQAIADTIAACASGLQARFVGTGTGDVSSARVDSVEANDRIPPSALQLTSDDQTKTLTITVFLGQSLMDSMDASQPDAVDRAVAEAAANLGLVLDVELDVTLRFGQRQLPLREVLDLKSGAVVELDRQVDEPVELVLDGKVIALGEAVIIDGNYGIRVTQVVQPLLAS